MIPPPNKNKQTNKKIGADLFMKRMSFTPDFHNAVRCLEISLASELSNQPLCPMELALSHLY